MNKKIIFAYLEDVKYKASKIKKFFLVNNYQIVSEISNHCIIKLSKEVEKIAKKDLSLRVILLDNYGIFPFMYLTKVKGFVVALVTEEHSSHMTMLHNNSNILILPLSIVALALAKLMIKSYLETEYENKRHKVRLQMLEMMV